MNALANVGSYLILWAFMLVFALDERVLSQDDRVSATEEDSWEEIASKRFPEETVKRLSETGMVVTDEYLRQIFGAYVHTDVPFFITSDAVLHAWHVIFEESLSRLEGARAGFLKDSFGKSRNRFPEVAAGWKDEDNPDVFKAIERAEIVLTVPLRLMKLEAPGSTPAIEKIIAAEVARIEAAVGAELPEWIGPPESRLLAIDYARCKPVGFYDRSDTLSRYFRAVRWLQLIPFRSDRDPEWLALFLLQKSILREATEAELFSSTGIERAWEEQQKFRNLENLFGVPDGFGLNDFNRCFEDRSLKPEVASLESVLEERTRLAKEVRFWAKRSPIVNDALRLPPAPGESEPIEFRILPARRLPDAVLFAKTTSPDQFPNRAFPGGLEVGAFAKSPFAAKALRKSGDDAVLGIVEEIGPELLEADDSLYGRWFRCVQALSENIDPEAPELFRTEAWERKTCETVLASWAHLRHALVLQSKLTIHYMGRTELPSGFIEPNPEFFSRLAGLAGKSAELFGQAGLFERTSAVQSLEIRDLADTFAGAAENLVLREPNPEDRKRKSRDPTDFGSYWSSDFDIWSTYELADKWLTNGGIDINAWSDQKVPDQMVEISQALKSLADDLLVGNRPPLKDDSAEKLAARWHGLETTCRRLEALCHKQLRDQPFTREEDQWLKGIGQHLGWLEFYEGNSWLTPRDDAPKIVEVFHSPAEGKRLHAASGRPVVLYLLYPWKGKDRLCRGGVMTYYEVKTPKPLGDDDWKKMLDGENPPRRLDWAERLVPGKIKKQSSRE